MKIIITFTKAEYEAIKTGLTAAIRLAEKSPVVASIIEIDGTEKRALMAALEKFKTNLNEAGLRALPSHK